MTIFVWPVIITSEIIAKTIKNCLMFNFKKLILFNSTTFELTINSLLVNSPVIMLNINSILVNSSIIILTINLMVN